MVIMALDHVREFFHADAMTGSPTNLATTTPVLFFTRWITHFCAPVFLFLSGLSAFLNGQKKTTKELTIFLIKRGFWLIVIEFVVISFVLTFNPFYNIIFLEVIWATGISMIILGLLIHLPFRIIALIGVMIFFGHNLLDAAEAARQGKLDTFWALLHGRNAFFSINANHSLLMGYSFLPWTGIMIMGYCFGRLYAAGTSQEKRKKILLGTGAAMVVLFIVLRFINVYGNPVPWASQKSPVFSFLSFLNTNKYPPSLQFSCMVLGPALIVLALTENTSNRVTAFFNIYGRVPLFYFIVHFFLIHILCMILFFVSGYTFKDAYGGKGQIFGFRPVEFGYPLWGVYIIWVLVIAAMYPLCKKYDRYKSTHQKWWLSYL